MALNLDSIGKKIGPFEKEYDWKDVILYSLGIGAGFDEVEYCWENKLKVIPTFSIASIFECLGHLGVSSGVNLGGILHGEQELIFHKPIPTKGSFITEGAIRNFYDKGQGKGALVVGQTETNHSNGDPLFTAIFTIFGRFDGGFGGEKSPANVVEYPDRDPDFVLEETPAENQPLLYRLTGDLFGLHVDSQFAKVAGFEKPIMHGLCTMGYACRALMKNIVPGEPEKVRRIACRFSKPLYPGVPIRTEIWKTDEGKAVWQTINCETGKPAITNGIFEYGDAPE